MSKTSLKKPKETRATLKPLPPQKRQKAEALSGMSMHDVGVHYNSNLPNQVGCHALTYGNQICLAPSMEKHMDHELGHVIQQKQGRVKPQVGNWNFSRSLEKGADQLGSRLSSTPRSPMKLNRGGSFKGVLQGKKFDEIAGAEDFIMKEHANKIETNLNTKNLVISFRSAGADTIKRMRVGSGKKGHDVLEKSIKDATINRLVDLGTGGNPNKDQVQKLSGLVGHWGEKNTKLEGVYLSEAGKKYLNELKKPKPFKTESHFLDSQAINDIIVSDDYRFNNMMLAEANENVLKLHKDMYDLLEIKEEGSELKGKGAKYSKYFLTGDYDLHDLGSMNGDKYSHIENGKDNDALKIIDNALRSAKVIGGENDSAMKNYTEDDTSYIRHGPQFNYVDFMQGNEKGKKMMYAQINADPKLLFYNANAEGEFKKWYKTDNMDELRSYYISALKLAPAEIIRFGNTRTAHLEQAKLRYENLSLNDEHSLPVLKEKYKNKKAKAIKILADQTTKIVAMESDFTTESEYIEALLELKAITMDKKWE